MILDISTLVPHAKPMLLVDRIITADQENMQSEIDIKNDSLFCENGSVAAWIGIEYMAQTVAAHAGYLAYLKNEPVKIGFLLGTRRYNCFCKEFPVNHTLQVQINRQYLSEDGLGSYKCTIYCSDKEMANAVITVFQPLNLQKNL